MIAGPGRLRSISILAQWSPNFITGPLFAAPHGAWLARASPAWLAGREVGPMKENNFIRSWLAHKSSAVFYKSRQMAGSGRGCGGAPGSPPSMMGRRRGAGSLPVLVLAAAGLRLAPLMWLFNVEDPHRTAASGTNGFCLQNQKERQQNVSPEPPGSVRPSQVGLKRQTGL